MRESHGGVKVDHRSLRCSSSSARSSWRLATGAGRGGGPDAASVGGLRTPDRTASAKNASARIGLRASLSGPNSATTRSRSVTSTVSPDAASRTYSLNRLFSTLIPTDRMDCKVATNSYFVNLHSVSRVTDAPHVTGAESTSHPSSTLDRTSLDAIDQPRGILRFCARTSFCAVSCNNQFLGPAMACSHSRERACP